jgi:hypothetical protein
MTSQIQQRDYGFVLGLLTGTVVGAGLAVWLAPGAAGEVRTKVTDTAERIGSELGRRGENLRDRVVVAAARGAREVEKFATDAASDRASL